MKFPRPRFSMRALLMLPLVVVVVMFLIDPLTARAPYWRLGTSELDVVNAATQQPIQARVARSYEGPLAGEPADAYTTPGWTYDTYRGMTPQIGYGGLTTIVRCRPKTLFFRRHDLTVAEGLRFLVEADGFEPFEFAPVDRLGRPLAFDTWDLPVFRVELRPKGRPEVTPSWRTRPELKHFPLK